MERFIVLPLVVLCLACPAISEEAQPRGMQLTLPLVPERAQDLAVEEAVQPRTDLVLPLDRPSDDEVRTLPHVRIKDGGPPILGVTIGAKSEAARIADERRQSSKVRPPATSDDPLIVEFDRR